MDQVWINRDAVFRNRWKSAPYEEVLAAAREFLPKYLLGVTEASIAEYARAVVAGEDFRV